MCDKKMCAYAQDYEITKETIKALRKTRLCYGAEEITTSAEKLYDEIMQHAHNRANDSDHPSYACDPCDALEDIDDLSVYDDIHDCGTYYVITNYYIADEDGYVFWESKPNYCGFWWDSDVVCDFDECALNYEDYVHDLLNSTLITDAEHNAIAGIIKRCDEYDHMNAQEKYNCVLQYVWEHDIAPVSTSSYDTTWKRVFNRMDDSTINAETRTLANYNAPMWLDLYCAAHLLKHGRLFKVTA